MTSDAPLTLEDVVAGARAVARRMARGEAAAAAAWSLRRRARMALLHRAATGAAHPGLGDGTLGAAALVELRGCVGGGGGATTLLRAAAALCGVLCGDVADPQENPAGESDGSVICGSRSR